MRAAGVNAIDWKRRRGLFAHGELLRKPAGTGIEVSGTIDAVGPDPPGWRVGQDVLGQVPTGAAATHVLAASDNLVAKPHWLAFEQAAALPVAAETASRTLRQLVLGKIVLAVPELSFIAPLHGTRSGWMVEGPERITATSYALDCAS